MSEFGTKTEKQNLFKSEIWSNIFPSKTAMMLFGRLMIFRLIFFRAKLSDLSANLVAENQPSGVVCCGFTNRRAGKFCLRAKIL